MKPITSQDLLEFYPNEKVLLKMTDIVLSLHNISRKERFWVSKNKKTQILVTSNHMSFERTFVKLKEQVCMSANRRFWLEIKWSVKQLLHRKLIFNDNLLKLNTKNSIWSQFILNETNGLLQEGNYFPLAAT